MRYNFSETFSAYGASRTAFSGTINFSETFSASETATTPDMTLLEIQERLRLF